MPFRFAIFLYRLRRWTVTLVAMRWTIVTGKEVDKLPQRVAFFRALPLKFHAFRHFVVMFNLKRLYIKVHLKMQQ